MPNADTRKLLEKATSEYQRQLKVDEEASLYLQDRGITREAQDFFRLGVVREPIDGHESYQNRIVFPYETTSGITSLRFRVLGTPRGKQPKFLSLPGEVTRIYNVLDLAENEEIFLCEGETDTIAVWQAGYPAVGIPGANNWAPSSKVLSRVFANHTVTVLTDNDDKETGAGHAGQNFARDVYRTLGGCKSILMPKGHDVSSFIQEAGTDGFEKLIARSSS